MAFSNIPNIGFSTGSLAKGNVNKAFEMLRTVKTNAIEISALRENELGRVIDMIDKLDLSTFDYISFHAPSKLYRMTEQELVDSLIQISSRKFQIVVHPDIIKTPERWGVLGEYLCIENMDKRKPFGQTAKDLERLFNILTEASFCFDIAHAYQVDPTMNEGFKMLHSFHNKLRQIHVSSLNTECGHEALTLEALLSYKKISKWIPEGTPIIIESPVKTSEMPKELKMATLIMDDRKFLDHIRTTLGSMELIQFSGLTLNVAS